MKKKLAILFIMAFALGALPIYSSHAWATSVTVCDDSPATCDYATISLALAGVGSGAHTIAVQGTYTAEAAFTVSNNGTSVGSELHITSASNHLLPKVTISGNYIKLSGFKFIGEAATVGQLSVTGNDVIIDNCLFRQLASVNEDGVIGMVLLSGARITFSNNDLRNIHKNAVLTLNDSSYITIIGNTFYQNCSAGDILRIFGHDHTFSQNTFYDLTYDGIRWQANETLEKGECRSTATGNPASTVLYWEVTTAGQTGGSEPENFNLTGKSAGNTVSDGGVTWTARVHSMQHPDVFQTYGDSRNGDALSYNMLIERNILYQSSRVNTYTSGAGACQIGNISQDGSNNIRDWTFRNNIFMTGRAFNISAPGFKFYNNNFIGTTYHEQQPLLVGCIIWAGCASGFVAKNNVFLGTGDTAPNPNAVGWYSSDAYIARPRNTAIYNATTVVPSTWQGYAFKQVNGGCTTGDTTEPAGMSLPSATYTFTANVTKDSCILTNVSTFTGIEYFMWVRNDSYVSTFAYIDSYDAGAGTITLKSVKPGETLCGMVSGSAISFTAKKLLYYYPSSYGEKLTNPLVDVNTAGWTATNATLALDNNGVYEKALKITVSANGGKAYEVITGLAAETEYALLFHYKNTLSDVAQYGIYDVSNSTDIVSPIDLADSTSWSAWKKIVFTTPAGCTSIRIDLLGKTNGDVVYFDNISVRGNGASTTAGASIAVFDGTCYFLAFWGYDIQDTDYNYVSKRGPGYEEKTYFTLFKNPHDISGGDPKMVSEATRNYSIVSSSPLKDKGVDLSDKEFSNDYLGNTRSGTWDIGAYEYYEQGSIHSITSMGVSRQ